MSSRNRKFRRRADDDQEGEEPESLGMPPASIIAARKAKEKEKKVGKKPSLLSFDEEDGASPTKAKADSRAKEKIKPKLKPNLKNLSIAEDNKSVHRTQLSAAGVRFSRHLCALGNQYSPQKCFIAIKGESQISGLRMRRGSVGHRRVHESKASRGL